MAGAKNRNLRRPVAPTVAPELHDTAAEYNIPEALLADPVSEPTAAPAPAVDTPAEPVSATVTGESAAAIVSSVTSAKESTMDAINETKTVFAEATEQAKTGFAKSQALFADMGEFNKGNIEALVESSKIAAKGLETLGQGAAAFVRSQFEDAQAQARSLASVTSPTEFMKLQGDFARSSFEKMIAQTSTNTEAMLKLVSEVAQPISNRVAIAADKMKVAA